MLRYSRLAILVCVSAWFCLPQRALSQGPAKPLSTLPKGTITWHRAGEIEIPFEYFRQHIYVPVTLNGKPGFEFMLDSGANRNVIDLRAARELGMKLRHLNQQSNIGFGNGLIYTAPGENVSASIENVTVAQRMSVLDLNRFAQHFDHRTDGMLGYPFFQKFVVKLDFSRKVLTILPALGYVYRGAGILMPLQPSKDFVVMQTVIGTDADNYSKVNLVVDSGSNLIVMLYKRFVPALHLAHSLSYAYPTKGFGLDGPYPMSLGTISLLQIGQAEARNVMVAYLGDDPATGPARHVRGSIGNGILQSFQTVIFDVPHRLIIFELKPQPWQSGVVRTYTASK